MKQVIFICKTCEYRNKHNIGGVGYIPLKEEFESLTDAWNHIFDTFRSDYHVIEAVVKENK